MKRSVVLLLLVTACRSPQLASSTAEQAFRWQAGDHHIHSEFSVGWDRSVSPPTPILKGDGFYPIPKNALMAHEFGLDWMASTDHGGPGHSKVNHDHAYPAVLAARQAVPDVIQFFGMEFDVPGARHSSLIIPHSDDEAEQLYFIESQFARREPFPADPQRETEGFMISALSAIKGMETPPVIFANHPGRSASGIGEYTDVSPKEIRQWHETAPEVVIGMEAAPGHQAATLNPDGSQNNDRPRGSYKHAPTLGGYDQMTAQLGGFWDSMLGEGRKWWVTANSDSHRHYTEGGKDFWPGEYTKTYVFAQKNHDSILQGLREGRVFVVTGDLITDMTLDIHTKNRKHTASIGQTLLSHNDQALYLSATLSDPDKLNYGNANPSVNRIDIILGEVHGKGAVTAKDTDATTRILYRLDENDWTQKGDEISFSVPMPKLNTDYYIRVRGTNTDELEPRPDEKGESPWGDLWFYSNPIFVKYKN